MALDTFYHSQNQQGLQGEGNIEIKDMAILSLLSKVKISGRILDVGCAGGSFADKYLSAKNSNIFGIDVSEEAVQTARKRNIRIVKGNIDISRIPYKDSSFGLVIFSEVIEHLVNPDSALADLHRILNRDGGYLLIATPNLASWYNRFLLLFGMQPLFTDISLKYSYGRFFSVCPSGHLRLYTYKALVFLLEKYGFKTVYSRGIGVNPALGYGKKLGLFCKITNFIFRGPSLNSGICILAKKI